MNQMTEEEKKEVEETPEDPKAEEPEEEKSPEKDEDPKKLTPEEEQEALREREEELAKKSEEEEDEDEDEEEDDFFEDKESYTKEDIDKLVESKLKPFKKKEEERLKNEQVKVREAFFKNHPEYLSDSKKWQKLLDTMEDLSPNLSYEDSLAKAQLLLDGHKQFKKVSDDYHKKEAVNAATSKTTSNQPKDNSGLSEADKTYARQNGYTFDQMKNFRKKVNSGNMIIHHNAL